ncbi:hypothetical protein F8M41_016886 [Gigaspora margarita]|uniref:Uncharacterized protein n=1 Tax=Gigaspora margarita TaxID=4874 RepID=A0A8H4ANS3_GIGMA|nr:hypothetical protein F8M41_016886 [Gigaspora margarita]
MSSKSKKRKAVQKKPQKQRSVETNEASLESYKTTLLVQNNFAMMISQTPTAINLTSSSEIDTPSSSNEIYVPSVSKDIPNKLPGQSLENKEEQPPTFTELEYNVKWPDQSQNKKRNLSNDYNELSDSSVEECNELHKKKSSVYSPLSEECNELHQKKSSVYSPLSEENNYHDNAMMYKDQLQQLEIQRTNETRLFTVDDFNYTITLLDSKINALYKLCRFLRKLTMLDGLTEKFWNIISPLNLLIFKARAYKEVAKQLIPTNLFPSTREYRIALESYLSEHAENFISSIGENAWISMFDSKILSECHSKRNDIAAAIRHTLFSVFNEEHLDHIDSNISPIKLAEWKSSVKTKAAYEELFKDQQILLKIGYTVFKQYKNKELPPLHCAFILSICDILLNPKSLNIKCSDKSVMRRVDAFLREFESKKPITPQIILVIAEAEANELKEIKLKNQKNNYKNESFSSSIQGSEDLDNDYDNLMNNLDSQFSNSNYA